MDDEILITVEDSEPVPNERYFMFVEPADEEGTAVIRRVTETEVRETYWPYWQQQMRKAGKGHLINFEECCLDFCSVHWAVEMPPGGK